MEQHIHSPSHHGSDKGHSPCGHYVCLAHARSPALASSPSPFKPMMAALFHCCWCLVLGCSVVSNSLGPYGSWPARILCPWNVPGKNTGMDDHFLLQGIFTTQGSYLLLISPALASGFSTTEPPGKPTVAWALHHFLLVLLPLPSAHSLFTKNSLAKVFLLFCLHGLWDLSSPTRD